MLTDVPVANPVLPGFSPDPSIVRVDSDYYLVTSTFQFFPAIAIHHSTDLRTWRRIGHVFTRPEELDLSHFYDGCGIWAPDISHHNGEFHIFFCLVQLRKDRSVNVRGNYMVKSRSVLGPYTSPVQLTSEGNDPSHFVDADGSHHMVYAAGIPTGRGVKIVRLSEDCSRVVEPPRWLEFGGEKRAPEGPHIFRHNQHYYLTLAAGGGIYAGHHQLIARSRNLHGPYEECPNGPFIVEHSPTASYYHHGHAKLVRSPLGEWHAVYLLRRRIGGFSPLGRETAVDSVHWNSHGWPVLNAGKGPSDRPPITARIERDDFDRMELGPEWMFIRRPLQEAHTLAARPGHLRLSGGVARLDEPLGVNAVLRRETHLAYTATTLMDFSPKEGEEAGLIAYYDTASHLRCVLTRDTEPVVSVFACEGGCIRELAREPLQRAGRIHLRMCVKGLIRAFELSFDGVSWTRIASLDTCGFLSDEGTTNWGFTGTLVGLYARRAAANQAVQADFDWITLEPT